jgi:hypothetical protein
MPRPRAQAGDDLYRGKILWPSVVTAGVLPLLCGWGSDITVARQSWPIVFHGATARYYGVGEPDPETAVALAYRPAQPYCTIRLRELKIRWPQRSCRFESDFRHGKTPKLHDTGERR